jgi:hypothetical protein
MIVNRCLMQINFTVKRLVPGFYRQMATASSSVPHLERTKNDFRQEGLLYNAKISKVDEVNSSIRLIELALPHNEVGEPCCISRALNC